MITDELCIPVRNTLPSVGAGQVVVGGGSGIVHAGGGGGVVTSVTGITIGQ